MQGSLEITELRETLVSDPEVYFRCLSQDILRAERSVDLESYIFDDDSVGRMIADALSSAASRGVVVRVLVDGVGSPFFGGSLAEALSRSGVRVEVFHPPPWHFWQWKFDRRRGPLVSKFLKMISLMNRRNHRKVCVVDRKIAWVGSFNISESHLGRKEKGASNWEHGWSDIAFRSRHSDMGFLSAAFDDAWSKEKSSSLTKLKVEMEFNPSHTFRLNFTRGLRKDLIQDLIARFSLSKDRIWICNPYFIPSYALLKAIMSAARRGVDVRFVFPQTSDIFFMPWISTLFYVDLLGSGAKIFEFKEKFLHSKIMIIDDFSTVGSSNLNHRSLFHDLEVDARIDDVRVKGELESKVRQDMESSTEIKKDGCPRRNIVYRFLGRLLLNLKYWF